MRFIVACQKCKVYFGAPSRFHRFKFKTMIIKIAEKVFEKPSYFIQKQLFIDYSNLVQFRLIHVSKQYNLSFSTIGVTGMFFIEARIT